MDQLKSPMNVISTIRCEMKQLFFKQESNATDFSIRTAEVFGIINYSLQAGNYNYIPILKSRHYFVHQQRKNILNLLLEMLIIIRNTTTTPRMYYILTRFSECFFSPKGNNGGFSKLGYSYYCPSGENRRFLDDKEFVHYLYKYTRVIKSNF